MLIIERDPGGKVFIGDCITVTLVDVVDGVVRLAIEAPRDVPIKRGESLPYQEAAS